MLLKQVERPRELKWHQAGAMLYGDWGTSKAYVLGIAFALSGHASWLLLGCMSILTALVGICYMTICRIYPDGGGVYSSVKHRSQLLAVIGAFLLIADYVITASLSALEAFHYFGFPHPEIWAMGAIAIVGIINWVGPTKSSNIASVIAVSASAVAGILFISTLPSLPNVHLEWPTGGLGSNWTTFVGIVLALSGVEAVANMTGIMVEPVGKTARKAIWPVLLEVSVLTFLLGMAMNAIPDHILSQHTEDMLRALGTYYIGPWYGKVISIIFGFLLLSAVNTAISDLVSIQFLMAKDHELPSPFAKLNRFGMPGLSLLVATVVPILVLVFEHDLVHLAALYAIGVVGAICINLGGCATNFQISLKKWERPLLFVVAFILLLIEITIVFQKHNALIFALTVLTVGLLLRYTAKHLRAARPVEVLVPTVNVLSVSEAKDIVSLYQSSSMVALKSLNLDLLDEAALHVKAQNQNSIYVSYVEEIPPSRTAPKEIEPAPESVALLDKAQKEMEKRGITAIPLWLVGAEPGRIIAHAAEELGVRMVMIGTTKRSALISLLRGNVLRTLAKHLPKECRLLITG